MNTIENNPLVSVLMPVYNAAPYLDEAISSITRQTFRDFEFLIYDDGSTDGSLDIMRDWARRDSRIVVHSAANRGLLEVLRQGVEHAQAPWIARMDADDIADPQRFEKQVEHLRKHPQCVVLGTRIEWISPSGLSLGPAPVSLDHDTIERELLENLPGKICHPTVMMCRDTVLAVGNYQQEGTLEDVELFLRMAEVGELHNLSDVLLQYRLHGSSICHTFKADQRAKIYQAVASDAYRRRGRETPGDLKPRMEPHPQSAGHSAALDHVEHLRTWTWMALGNGKRCAALRLALQALMLAPRDARCWWTACHALMGREFGGRFWNGLARLKGGPR